MIRFKNFSPKGLPKKKILILMVVFLFFLMSEIRYKAVNTIFNKYQSHIHQYSQSQYVHDEKNNKHLHDTRVVISEEKIIEIINISKIVNHLPKKYDPKFEASLKGLKTILFWTPINYDPLFYLNEKGQKGFIDNKCKINECFATDDRKVFGDDITKFDAIVFNGQAFKQNNAWNDLPKYRSEHQTYIFYELQSASDHPLCSDKFDNFFNWTMTYRLDSDIPCPFIVIKNKTGHKVGPKEEMVWQTSYSHSNDTSYMKKKKKTIAWFPSDCTRQAPMIFCYTLKEALTKYKLGIDVYGDCGPLVCVKGNRECEYINKEYFFLLILENSQAQDYVTDKVLVALQNNVVPIVYGGANYSRFLPPGSYLDGTTQSAEDIAAKVVTSMGTGVYQIYFEWKPFYSFHKAEQIDYSCDLCAALHENTKQRKVYKKMRRWWNSEYRDKCNETSSSVNDFLKQGMSVNQSVSYYLHSKQKKKVKQSEKVLT